MKLFKKQAFTLVELIVVITILAILGTISFVSLQSYTREARDSKRLSDINNIQKKISIEMVKGTSLSSLITLIKTNSGLTINSASGTSIQGTANFQTLKEDGSKFKDPITGGDYVMSYSVGGNGTGAYKFTQVSTINEENNQAVVNGNYYQMQSGDSESIIKNDSDSFVINEGSNLPYEPVIANIIETGKNWNDGVNYFTFGSLITYSVGNIDSSPADVSGLAGGCFGTNIQGTDSTTDGQQNSIDYLAGCGGSNAIKYCDDLTLGGKSDWYLPAKDEAQVLVDNYTIIGDLNSSTYYWTSTEKDASVFWIKRMSDGYNNDGLKHYNHFLIRCIRQTN